MAGDDGQTGTITAPIPRRTLSAQQVAARLGRQKRIVLLWATRDGCPHTMGMRRKQRSPCFNLDEVKEWLRSRGMPEVLSATRAKGEPAEPRAEDKADPSVFELPYEEQLAKASGEVDLRMQIKRLNAQYNALMEKRPPMNAQADWAAKWAERVNLVSKELRQLEADAFKADERKGVWIRKAEATAMLAAEAAQFAAAMQSMRGRLPAELVAAIAEIVPPDRIDQVRRVVAATVAAVTTGAARELADAIASQAVEAA